MGKHFRRNWNSIDEPEVEPKKSLEFSTHIEKKDRKNMKKKNIYIYNVEDKMRRSNIYLI